MAVVRIIEVRDKGSIHLYVTVDGKRVLEEGEGITINEADHLGWQLQTLAKALGAVASRERQITEVLP